MRDHKKARQGPRNLHVPGGLKKATVADRIALVLYQGNEAEQTVAGDHGSTVLLDHLQHVAQPALLRSTGQLLRRLLLSGRHLGKSLHHFVDLRGVAQGEAAVDDQL